MIRKEFALISSVRAGFIPVFKLRCGHVMSSYKTGQLQLHRKWVLGFGFLSTKIVCSS